MAALRAGFEKRGRGGPGGRCAGEEGEGLRVEEAVREALGVRDEQRGGGGRLHVFESVHRGLAMAQVRGPLPTTGLNYSRRHRRDLARIFMN